MRVSADIEDRDYSHAAAFLQVFLDGDEVRMCITADDTRGEVLCYDVDEKGYIRFDPGSVRAKTVTLTGKVEIVVHPGSSPEVRSLTADQLVERYQVID